MSTAAAVAPIFERRAGGKYRYTAANVRNILMLAGATVAQLVTPMGNLRTIPDMQKQMQIAYPAARMRRRSARKIARVFETDPEAWDDKTLDEMFQEAGSFVLAAGAIALAAAQVVVRRWGLSARKRLHAQIRATIKYGLAHADDDAGPPDGRIPGEGLRQLNPPLHSLWKKCTSVQQLRAELQMASGTFKYTFALLSRFHLQPKDLPDLRRALFLRCFQPEPEEAVELFE